MEKTYSRINFQNSPTKMTPLSAANLNKMDKAIDELDNRSVDADGKIKELKGRMDAFTSLGEGSTTGDAELIDGRVDYKGDVHTNIGEHIREVSSQLSSDINECGNAFKEVSTEGKLLLNPFLTWEYGTLSGNDGSESDSNARLRTVTTINTNLNIVDVLPCSGYEAKAYYYNSDGTFSHSNGTDFFNNALTLDTGYIVRIVIRKVDLSEFTDNKVLSSAITICCKTKLSDSMDFLNSVIISPNMLNLASFDILTGKYMRPDGKILDSATGVLSVSEYISVITGVTYSFGGDERIEARMLCAFDKNKNAVASAGTEMHFTTWTCPEDIKYIRVTYHNDDPTMRMNEGETLLPYKTYGSYLPVGALDIDGIKEELKKEAEAEAEAKAVTPYLKITGDLSDGETLELEDNAVKTYKRLAFTATIVSFDKLHIGHGTTGYASNYIVIDNTKLYVYESGSLTGTYEHGLTIENTIQVRVSQDATSNAKIRIASSGKVYELEEIHWYGSNGMIFVKSEGSELTDCVFSWTCQKYSADIFAFGDSYFGIGNAKRWVYYLLSDGHTNIFLDGFGGRNSATAYNHAVNALKHGTLKILLWCLGMNDGDNDTSVNSSWNNRYNSIKTLCEEKEIELVLATIPSTPTVNNKYKNEIIRNSGHRYIDFAKAVGADDNTGEWYSGMLDGDNVHPTEYGAIALYGQALADLPELLLC